ncbi:RNA polymerase sigma factor [Cohnella boryungensis]|uniref:RNA polymerase sigma factor n=2 Tax=Cohnella boryungensis TaxID=768479 RepID=A0ABV8SE74_9BACL
MDIFLLGGEDMELDDNQRRAIEELFQDMLYRMSTYAQNTLHDRSLAEEAVQDTFRIACTRADKLLSSPNSKGWLLNTLKYVIKNTIRSRAYLNSIVISSVDFDENIISIGADTPDVDFFYSDLANNEDYKLVKKVALDKYSMLEVAQELGISVEACKKRVQRAKKRLKNRFKENRKQLK